MRDNNRFLKGLEKLEIELGQAQLEQFERYYDLLVEWNAVMNLTAITEYDEVITKHFLDSLSIVKVKGVVEDILVPYDEQVDIGKESENTLPGGKAVLPGSETVLQSPKAVLQGSETVLQSPKAVLQGSETVLQNPKAVLQGSETVLQDPEDTFLDDQAVSQKSENVSRETSKKKSTGDPILSTSRHSTKLLDIGTGAGFPGIPLKIAFPQLNITLMDSLNKRINFLNEVIRQLSLKNIIAIHGRAEEFGRKEEFREQYDCCVSRAVARLVSLSEYCLPFVKKGGYFIPYKSVKSDEELEEAKYAIGQLGGKYLSKTSFLLPGSDAERTLFLIRKSKETPKKYPRAGGKAASKPLLQKNVANPKEKQKIIDK